MASQQGPTGLEGVPSCRRFVAGGDRPGPRCGHTLTATASPGALKGGGEGLMNARLVLFGGATALEGEGRGRCGRGQSESDAWAALRGPNGRPARSTQLVG